MIPQDLLDILRCPHCVSGSTRVAGDDPGRLLLARESWLVCQEAGCHRKYPIADNIPDMRIETGSVWQAAAVADLPAPPAS